MIIQSICQKIFYKLFCVLMSLIFSFGTGYVAPSVETPISPENPEEVKGVFALVADPQVSNYLFGRYSFFKASAEDLHNAECDFDAVIGVGDITENAFEMEYQLVYDGLHGLDTQYIMAVGNHDVRLRLYCQSRKSFCRFANALNNDEEMQQLYFSKEVAGYKFIVLGTEKAEFESAYLSDEQLEWLDDELAGENGKPAFIICHQPLKDTHNIEVAWGSSFKAGASVGDQSIALKAIMSKYDNVFLISGHLHSGFGPDNYNIVDGTHSINCPSVSVENKDGLYNGAGLGYILEVYEDYALFRARDMAKGTWVAETTGDSSYDIKIPFEE